MARTDRPVARAARRRRGWIVLATAMVVATLTSCDWMVVEHIDTTRASAGRGAVASSATLTDGARIRAQAMCDAGAASAAADPAEEFDAETAAAVQELTGSAPLDPTIADAFERNKAATRAVIDGWGANAVITDPRWTDAGVGDVACPDGNLYVSAAFSQRPTTPASGRYASPQHPAAQIQKVSDVQYGTALNHAGVPTPLIMDLWAPPSAGAPDRPVLIMIHGGGFAGGSRTVYNGAAVDAAALGYVVVSIDYRLRPPDSGGADRTILAANDAIDDAMEAVRWLKANAATYRIDVSRIGALGASAGGVIALGLALGDDLTPGGPLAVHSPAIAAAVSTGGHLTPGLPLLTLAASDPAVLMFNHETDPSAGPVEVALETCTAVRASGNTCDFVTVPGDGHTSWITPGSPFWSSEVSPFLWHHLRLGAP